MFNKMSSENNMIKPLVPVNTEGLDKLAESLLADDPETTQPNSIINPNVIDLNLDFYRINGATIRNATTQVYRDFLKQSENLLIARLHKHFTTILRR